MMHKPTLSLILFSLISLNVCASCPENLPDLSDMLRKPLGKGEIIAIVKGHWYPTFDHEIGSYVDYFEVKQSYGLVIAHGRYKVMESSTWGNNCAYYREFTKLHDTEDKKGTIYLALSRIHGRVLATPEAAGHGFYLTNGQIYYKNSDEKLQFMAQRTFENHLLQGINPSWWIKE